MGNQHKHEILSVAVKVAAFDESGIRRDFFNSLLLPNQPRLAASPLAVYSYWAKWHGKRQNLHLLQYMNMKNTGNGNSESYFKKIREITLTLFGTGFGRKKKYPIFTVVIR